METQIPEKELSVKVLIADKHYPMKIDAEEEERVRKAAKMVNEKMMEFKDTYAADKQDLLAMSALTFAIEASKNKENVVTEDQDFIDKLNEIENIVDSALKK